MEYMKCLCSRRQLSFNVIWDITKSFAMPIQMLNMRFSSVFLMLAYGLFCLKKTIQKLRYMLLAPKISVEVDID